MGIDTCARHGVPRYTESNGDGGIHPSLHATEVYDGVTMCLYVDLVTFFGDSYGVLMDGY